jgi:hypothetical protein
LPAFVLTLPWVELLPGTLILVRFFRQSSAAVIATHTVFGFEKPTYNRRSYHLSVTDTSRQ